MRCQFNISRLFLSLFLSFSFSQSHAAFTAGTQVIFEGELVPIESIKTGNYVLGQHETNGKVWTYPVASTFSENVDELVVLTIGDEILETVAGQRFLTQEDKWTKAEDLQVGDRLIGDNQKSIVVKKVGRKTIKKDVYIFEVEKAHTFFVGRQRILAHNAGDEVKCCPYCMADNDNIMWAEVEKKKRDLIKLNFGKITIVHI